MKTALRRIALAMLMVAACGEPPAVEAQPASRGLFAAAPADQWTLPAQLGEISGLAVSPDGRLFAHDDEHGVIYQLDTARGGAPVKSFALGDPVITGDFEGLAITSDGAFWMTTSEGRLYRFAEGADGAHVTYETFDSGLEEICEIEGLAYLQSDESLVLACKRNKARGMRDTISLYRWAFTGAAQSWRTLRERDIAAAAGVERFRPSSVEIDRTSGRTLVLSARDGAVAELGADGGLVFARALGGAHAQAEGAAVLPDGSLVISDEAAGGRALLSRYARTQ